MNIGHIILYAIVPIIVIMGLGFFSGRSGAFDGKAAKMLNKLVLVYALPAALFVAIVDASRQMLVQDIKLSLISLFGIMFCFMAVYFIYKYMFKVGGASAAVSALISGSPTIGFLGFAVLEPIFGTNTYVALVVAIVGIVVNAVGIPVGLSLLNAAKEKTTPLPAGTPKPSAFAPVIHALKQPVAWAPLLAVFWVICGFGWPKYLSPSFDLIKGANASVAVFAAGVTLSSVKISINAQAWFGSFMKLIFMPAILLILGIIFHMDPMNLKMLVVAGVLPPAFSGIIIASERDTYVATGTSSLALSVVLFMAFCPIWIAITDACIKHFL